MKDWKESDWFQLWLALAKKQESQPRPKVEESPLFP